MRKELELWRFISERLARRENVMLLVVAESFGSSPGRQGFKMAIAADGTLFGSIGGGVMEVKLVEQSLQSLYASRSVSRGETLDAILRHQVHRQNVPDSSGMICSGKQTVIFKLLCSSDTKAVNAAIDSFEKNRRLVLQISTGSFTVSQEQTRPATGFSVEKHAEDKFEYVERLGPKHDLYIVGGGHCALALSELMYRLDFAIRLFDDRPELNTIEKNRFVDEVVILDGYENIAEHIPSSTEAYVVVMTLGFASDAAVIRSLIDKDLKYFGVMGSKAKMAVLLKELEAEGVDAGRLKRIHTPIGISINSRTPEEIAVSIAAQIISIKNARQQPAGQAVNLTLR